MEYSQLAGPGRLRNTGIFLRANTVRIYVEIVLPEVSPRPSFPLRDASLRGRLCPQPCDSFSNVCAQRDSVHRRLGTIYQYCPQTFRLCLLTIRG